MNNTLQMLKLFT